MDQRNRPDFGNNVSSCDVFVVTDVPHPTQTGGFYVNQSIAYMVYPTVPIVENQLVHLIFRMVPNAHHLEGILFQSRAQSLYSFRSQNRRRSYQYNYRRFVANETRGTRRSYSVPGGESIRQRFFSYRDGSRRSDHRFEPMPTRPGNKCNPFAARRNDGQSLVEGVSALNITLQNAPSQPSPGRVNLFSASPADFAIPSTSQTQFLVKQEPEDDISEEEEEEEEEDEYDDSDSL